MQNFRHVIPIEVRFRDLDVFGHVNNGVIFTYIETARIRYLVDVGVRSPQAGWNDLAFILAHLNCDFRKPIFYAQRVEVGSRIVEIKRSSMRLAHRIEALEKRNEQLQLTIEGLQFFLQGFKDEMEALRVRLEEK